MKIEFTQREVEILKNLNNKTGFPIMSLFKAKEPAIEVKEDLVVKNLKEALAKIDSIPFKYVSKYSTRVLNELKTRFPRGFVR